MPEETRASNAFNVVLKDYLSRGETGMEDLKRDIAAMRPSPVLVRFCEELHGILQETVPVPTDAINMEFLRRAAEAKEDGELEPDALVTQASDREAYEMCADLWKFLELEVRTDGDDTPTVGPAGVERPLRSPLVPGDPVRALRTWLSLPLMACFLGGTLVCVTSYWAHQQLSNGFFASALLLVTVVGFLCATGAAALLWLRRTRYVDPDAFLPKKKNRPTKD